MAIDRTENSWGEEYRQKIGYIFENPTFFSDIFDGVPQFYVGSTIVIQEVLTIISEVIPGLEKFVDVDMRWFNSKTYFGTYQLGALESEGLETEAEGGQGYLTANVSQIKRYSYYTICADPDVPIGAGDAFVVNNCNFGTVEAGITFGGAEIKIAKPVKDEALFTGTISRQRCPLKDREYFPRLKSVGLYLNPGCRLVSLNQKIRVVNAIATDYDAYPEFVCEPLGG